MNDLSQNGVRFLEVSEEESGQRLDNYLLRKTAGVPKTRIYRAIRKGEVRVNKGRCKVDYRVQATDVVRVPPLSVDESPLRRKPSSAWEKRLRNAVLLDDSDLLVLNKPPGMAVHGGSGVRLGLIESLRVMYPQARYLELVHRLDRDTSGLVLIAKNARVLRELHAQLRANEVDKIYWACTAGKWPAYQKSVSAPLAKTHAPSGERIVRVSPDGKRSRTEFKVIERFQQASLLEVKPISGRTHQIRVHVQHVGYPILGESKYLSDESGALTQRIGLKRLFLHAKSISFKLSGEHYELNCPIDQELESVLARLRGAR
jgi:23S rRNA pseudouridine955/2504/2580 synthase